MILSLRTECAKHSTSFHLAFLTIFPMWLPNLRSSDSITPDLLLLPCVQFSRFQGLCTQPLSWWWPHPPNIEFDQVQLNWRVCYLLLPTDIFVLNHFAIGDSPQFRFNFNQVASAKEEILDHCTFSSLSATCIRNNIGLSTVPWATPLLTNSNRDSDLEMVALCVFHTRKSQIHSKMHPPIQTAESCESKTPWTHLIECHRKVQVYYICIHIFLYHSLCTVVVLNRLRLHIFKHTHSSTHSHIHSHTNHTHTQTHAHAAALNKLTLAIT